MTEIQPQKIIIEEDGSIQIDWINPAFSDTILELLPKEERQRIEEFYKDSNTDIKNFKIWCG